MFHDLFYRNVRAREQLDIVFISAIGSLLLTRFLLFLTGYPQVGGNGLHIGHMLWGGLFMLASITISLSFLGLRVQRLSALLGGIGFGVFIDEIGKFITSDNNYFFRPAVGIIYAIFVILYLTFNFLGRAQKLTSREYQLNALAQLEEAILHDMDPLEKQRSHYLLSKAAQRSPLTGQLKLLLDHIDPIAQNEFGTIRKLLNGLNEIYHNFWLKRNTRMQVRIFFIAQAGLFVLAIVGNIYNNFDDIARAYSGIITYGAGLLVGQFVSSLVAAGFVVYGAFWLSVSRVTAFEYFRRATLINIFLTEFFVFSRISFGALPGFLFNLGVLLIITYVVHQEQRMVASELVSE